MALTEKQKRFVSEYLVDLNATQAAIRAGYSARTADRIGPELLGKTCVSKAVQQEVRARAERTGITQDQVLEELGKIALAEAADYSDTKLKVGNKLRALELLGKHLGLFDKAGNTGEQDAIDAFVRATRPVQGELEELYAEKNHEGVSV